VPLEVMLRRIDRLADLGTTIITLSGGEPTLHPDLDAIIRRIRGRGAIATVITNGLLLTPDRIRALNRAGLDYLQISIDNVAPDEVSKKSLRVLDRKLEWLARHAEFGVTINSVLGAGVRNPEDAIVVGRRARELGFTSTVGILHDHGGQLQPLALDQRSVYDRFRRLKTGLFSFAHFDHFQENIGRGLPNDWHCRSGGRFLYVCEDGLVHYCSQQRGRPGIPLEEYTVEDIRRGGYPARSGASQGPRALLHHLVRSSDRPARRISRASAGNADRNSRPAARAGPRFSPSGRGRRVVLALSRPAAPRIFRETDGQSAGVKATLTVSMV
jgi:MoaA/NifB/PqqE/SkfB family radical SAM enzyme